MTLNYNFRNEAGEFAPKVLIADGVQIINPTEAMYNEAGYYRVPAPQPPTAEESEHMARVNRIDQLIALLAESDYKAIKYAEGWLTAEDYAPIKAERQAWREEINELEAEE